MQNATWDKKVIDEVRKDMPITNKMAKGGYNKITTLEQAKKDPRVDDIFYEFGNIDPNKKDWWIYLKDGYECRSMGCGTIHEQTLKEALHLLNTDVFKKMAKGGVLSDVDMYVKIHGYYPEEVMALRGDGMGLGIVKNEAHKFELSSEDSRRAEEMGYEFDYYDAKGWVEKEDDDYFAKGGGIKNEIPKRKIFEYVKNSLEYNNLSRAERTNIKKDKFFSKADGKEYYRLTVNGDVYFYDTIAKRDDQFNMVVKLTQGNYNDAKNWLEKNDYSKGGKTKWIQEAISKPGALRETAKRKGLIKGDEKLSKTDLKKLEKVGGKTGQRARLAETLKGLGKKKKMAQGGETKFINLNTLKGQSEVEKYLQKGWSVKYQGDKFAILERGSKKKMIKGGATFDDKVKAISKNLKGRKVPKKLQKDYGKTYDTKQERDDAARRIAGAMRAEEMGTRKK